MSENSTTIENLEKAFAGESMAHIKYLYFAKICRNLGAEDVAKVFEETAAQEVQHAFGHADLLFNPKNMTVEKALQYAIDGETYEYTEMYPQFRHEAEQEGNESAVKEFDEQITESREHAEMFQQVLEKAAKRFAALTKVEKRHAEKYQNTLNTFKKEGVA